MRAILRVVGHVALWVAGCVGGLYVGAAVLDAVPGVDATSVAVVVLAVSALVLFFVAAGFFSPRTRSLCLGLALGLVTSATLVGLMIVVTTSGTRID